MERPDEKNVFLGICLINLLMTVAFFVFVHPALTEETDEIRTETDNILNEIVEIENFTNKHVNMKEYAADISRQLETAEHALPEELEQSAVISMLQRNALKHNIRILAITPGQTKKESSLMVLPIQIKLNCNYFQLLDFLESLQEEDRFMKLDKLCVKTVDDRLSFEIEAAVYAMNDNESAD